MNKECLYVHTSEVRGSSQEYQTATAQERPRGDTPRPRSAVAAERSYPASEVRGDDERSYPVTEVRGSGWEELPHAPKPEAKGQWGGAIPRPRPGAVAGKTNPTSKELWLRGRRRA